MDCWQSCSYKGSTKSSIVMSEGAVTISRLKGHEEGAITGTPKDRLIHRRLIGGGPVILV